MTFCTLPTQAQHKQVMLLECIQSALANKANLQAARTDLIVANLQMLEAKNKYIPQVSLAYEYRYNATISSQVIPVGQFNAMPTDELRAIQFGTRWQQTAGVNIEQPLVDFAIKSKIAESKINEKIRSADLELVEEDLEYEVIKSFGNVLVRNRQLNSAVIDTARTYKSYELIKNKYDQRRVLKTDLNKALLNHNSAILDYKTAVSELLKEKIYLSYLTSIDMERLMENEIDFSPFLNDDYLDKAETINLEGAASVKQLRLKSELLEQQIKTEKYKYRPVISFLGYIGGNQYTNEFNPFQSQTWFGNNYAALSLKMPLLGGNTRYKIRELKSQIQGADYNRGETENKLTKDYLQAGEDIKKYKQQIQIGQQNVGLMKENVSIFQDRFNSGQYSANDLNVQELDLLKEQNSLLKQQADLINKEIERLKASGNITKFIKNLK